jgi:hypothetical protein
MRRFVLTLQADPAAMDEQRKYLQRNIHTMCIQASGRFG